MEADFSCKLGGPIDSSFKNEIYSEFDAFKNYYWSKLSDEDIDVRRQAAADLNTRLWQDICPVKDISEDKSFLSDSFDYLPQRGKNEKIFEKAHPGVRVSDRPSDTVVDIPKTLFERNPDAYGWVIAGSVCGAIALITAIGWAYELYANSRKKFSQGEEVQMKSVN